MAAAEKGRAFVSLRALGKIFRDPIVRLIGLLAVGGPACMPPSWGAGALLHPGRKHELAAPRRKVEAIKWVGAGVPLQGWVFRAEGTRRGTIVYLHGVADNRGASVGIADHFAPRGFDVVAYDSRAHGQSGGDACTYGYYEKEDLRRVLDKFAPGPIFLFGSSLGAAVALQTAAIDGRVSGVVSVAAFSDLRTVAKERSPFFASKGNVNEALRIAEGEARFRVEDVAPVVAAARIKVPVFVIHGDKDDETPPAHAQRIFEALPGKKTLFLVPGRGHNDALTAEVMVRIDRWISGVVGTKGTM